MITVPRREDHGAPRGGGGAGDRLARLHTLGELAEVAGDDEQRVVDPHAEPDHRRQGRRRSGHIHGVAEEGDYAQAHGEAQDRGEDGDPHRDGGAEGEQQDDDGRRSPTTSETWVDGLDTFWPR